MGIHSTLITDALGAKLGFYLRAIHSSGSPGQNTGSFNPTALTVGAGRGTVRGTRVGDDGVVRPGLGNTPGSETGPGCWVPSSRSAAHWNPVSGRC